MISSADFIRPLPFRRWVCWHQPSPVGKGAIARQRHAPATTCRADLMATGGQISCPPAGNFLSVSGQFPLSADRGAPDSLGPPHGASSLLHDRNKGDVVLRTLGRGGRPPRVVARARHPQLDAHESHRIGIGVSPVRDCSKLHCLPFANQVATFSANSTCICNSAIVALSSLSPARNRINSSRSDPVSSASGGMCSR